MKKSGILIHISSLPSDDAIGTLGKDAFCFIDVLSESGQRIWQVLPIHPTRMEGSPFQGPSVFAGNPNLIDLQMLVDIGDLSSADYNVYLRLWGKAKKHSRLVDFRFLWEEKTGFDVLHNTKHKRAVLRRAYKGFSLNRDPERIRAFSIFYERSRAWLDDYALFMVFKELYGWRKSWNVWKARHKFRKNGYRSDIALERLNYYFYLQFVFDEQMRALSRYATHKRIEFIGDIPIYPAHDSADVWAHRELFQLDKNGSMKWISAVPPDYFSKKGQLWGNPLYNWGVSGIGGWNKSVYNWWLDRVRRELEYFDILKIDHFRGFIWYGRVKPSARTAINAVWVKGPGEGFFDYLKKKLRKLPFILEDLGIITDEIDKSRRKIGPGMKVFQFADFSRHLQRNSHDLHLPRFGKRSSKIVFYTGTHDNETLNEWIGTIGRTGRKHLREYLKHSIENKINWQVIDLLSSSDAERVIFPMQDILFLRKDARMNIPGKPYGQWCWRMDKEQFHVFKTKSGKLESITRRNRR